MSTTIGAKCNICNEEVEFEIPDHMLVYRVGTGGAAAEMRSDIRTNGRAVTECSKEHEVGALLVSADRSDLPDALERQKEELTINDRHDDHRTLDKF